MIILLKCEKFFECFNLKKSGMGALISALVSVLVSVLVSALIPAFISAWILNRDVAGLQG
jgi:hypothetical protein